MRGDEARIWARIMRSMVFLDMPCFWASVARLFDAPFFTQLTDTFFALQLLATIQA